MAPYVTLLPVQTSVNLNTAPREVLIAVLPGLDLGTADRLVQERRNPFKSIENALALTPPTVREAVAKLQPNRLGTTSNYFQVRGRLRIADRVLEESSLIERRGTEMVQLSRERENSRGFGG
jgi:general secretion pathway protein K